MDEKMLLQLLGDRKYDALFEVMEQHSDESLLGDIAQFRGEWQSMLNAEIHTLQESKAKEDLAENQFADRVRKFIDKITTDSEAYSRRYPQFEKFIYIKAIHWTKQEAGKKPVYTRYLPHLEKEVLVFDELMYLRMNRLSMPYGSAERPFQTRDRSSGTVAVRNLSPWSPIQNTDDFFDHQIDQNIEVPTPQETFLLEATFYNGFQEGEEDVGAQIEYGCQSARMLVDFSSIPYFSETLLSGKKPRGLRIISKGNMEELEVEVISPKGVYVIIAENLKPGEKLMLDFKGVINWELVP